MSNQYSSDEAKFASDATLAYHAGKLDVCWTNMRKLSATRSSDLRVLANKALVELLYRFNSSRSDDYLAQLQKASFLAGYPITENKECLPGRISDGLHATSPTAGSAVISLHYNYALAMFQRRQFCYAERLLASLLGLIDSDTKPAFIQFPISAGVLICQKIFILWLDVNLCLQLPQRVFDISSHWLHQLDVFKKSTGTPIEDVLVTILAGITRPLRVLRLRACLFTGQIKQAEQDHVLLSESADDTTCGTWDTTRTMKYATAQLKYLQNNHQTTVMHLNALLALMKDSPSEAFRWELPLVWNNLSLSHFRIGEFGLARLKMRRALRLTDHLASDTTEEIKNSENNTGKASVAQLMRTAPLYLLNASYHSALLYNAGVQLLLTQNPGAAFSAFLSVVKRFPQNPRLWLRLAECCIKVQCPDNLSDWKLESRASCLVGSVGEGHARKILIGSCNEEPIKPWIESSTLAAPTLEFAALCLRNALFLLPRPPHDISIKGVSINELPVDRQRFELIKWANKQVVKTDPAVQPLTGLALIQVISATLLASAYVGLCLNNAVETIHCANQVLCSTEANPAGSIDTASMSTGCLFGWIGLLAPPAHRFLARLYLAEAHLIMDDLPAACSCLLAKDNVGGVESLSLFSLHSIKSYSGLNRGCTSLAPAYLLPQTHPQCGLRSDCQKTTADSFDVNKSAKSSTGDLQRVTVVQNDQCSPDVMPGQLIATRHPDFPANGDQAIGVQFYNLAVCCAVRGDFTATRQLLENAAPALLTNVIDPTKNLSISHGPDEIMSILYADHLPGISNLNNGVARLNYYLPAHFIRLWLYVELCEGRINSAVRFARAHCGHVAYSNRLVDIKPKNSAIGEDTPVLPIRFHIGGIDHPISPSGREQSQFYQQIYEGQGRYGTPQSTRQPNPTPLQILDPPVTRWNEAEWPSL